MKRHRLKRRYGRAIPHGPIDRRVDAVLHDRVVALAGEYVRDVKARRALGDHKAEYHAQRPKVQAYGALMRAGLTPRQAVDYFRSISEIP